MKMLGRMTDQPFYFLRHSSSSSVSSSSCDSSSIFVGVPVVRMGHTKESSKIASNSVQPYSDTQHPILGTLVRA